MTNEERENVDSLIDCARRWPGTEMLASTAFSNLAIAIMMRDYINTRIDIMMCDSNRPAASIDLLSTDFLSTDEAYANTLKP